MSHPLLYEVNTRCWLRALSEKSGTAITLANVPDSELAGWQKLGFTHIWLMGVWTTGPRARAEALKPPELRRAYDQVLPGWQEADVAGLALRDWRLPGPARAGGRGWPGGVSREAPRAWVEAAAGFCAEPCRVGSSVGQRSGPNCSCRARAKSPERSRSKPAPAFAGWRTAKTLTLRPGRIRSKWITAAPPRGPR